MSHAHTQAGDHRGVTRLPLYLPTHAHTQTHDTHTRASLTRNTLAYPSAAQHTLETRTRTHIFCGIHLCAGDDERTQKRNRALSSRRQMQGALPAAEVLIR